MEIIAPVTDYVRASLLTTQGDLVKHNGSVAARLPVGSTGRILRIGGDPLDLTYQNPGAFLFEVAHYAANPGVVTFNTVYSSAITLDLGTPVLNARYAVYAYISVLKDATANIIYTRLRKESGTAVVEMYPDYLSHIRYMEGTANRRYGTVWAGILKVTTAGTLVLEINGKCETGNGEVSIGQAEIYAHRMLVA